MAWVVHAKSYCHGGLDYTCSELDKNPRQCEAKILASREDSVSGSKRYSLVSVKDMTRVHNFSERKVAAIIARGGGIPDEDAPDVPEETRFWVLTEQNKVDSSTVRSIWPECVELMLLSMLGS